MGRVHHVDRPREDLRLLRAGLPGDMGEDHPGERMKRAACSKCDASTALQVEKEMSAFFGKQGHNTGGTVERMKSASSQDMG